MKTALIGYTGFVGGNILSQHSFSDLYNSKNIHEIQKHQYALVVSAGTYSEKWRANQEPEKDLANIENLIGHLRSISAERFVFISTVDVYPDPNGVDESTPIDASLLQPYGRNRLHLEDFIQKTFRHHTIVRLPGLFGKGLKKNFIYDFIHNNALNLTHCESIFQFYNLDAIWRDISVALDYNLPLVNFATEPISVKELALYVLNINFTNTTERPPSRYDFWTKYGYIYGTHSRYLYKKAEILWQIKDFVLSERRKLTTESL